MSHPARDPDVSIVIPFYNRVDCVRRCLASVLRQRETCDFEFEVIAVDNGSADGTRQELERWPIRVLDESKRGPSAARNKGLSVARGRIVVFTDSDCVASRSWLKRLVEPLLADPDLHGVGGGIAALRQDCAVAWYQQAAHLLDNRKFFRGGPMFPPFFATCNCAWRVERLMAVDGFDEDLLVADDPDLSFRILETGGRIAYVPEACIAHDHRRSALAMYRQAVNYGEAIATILSKYGSRLPRRHHISWEAWLALGHLPFLLVELLLRGEFRAARLWPALDAIWQTGFLVGRLKGSWKYRTICL